MEVTNLLVFTSRQQLREWLEHNHLTEKCCWVACNRSKTTKPDTLPYLEIVEEALCFGWIDSTAGTLDPTHQLRRFTPRKKGSPYSRPNIERLIWLDANGMIHPKVRDSVIGLIQTPYVFPEDILSAIREDEMAWKNYLSFPEPYRRIRVAYIDAARKRPEEFARRLSNFIDKTKRNKQIVGYGGVDKYY